VVGKHEIQAVCINQFLSTISAEHVGKDKVSNLLFRGLPAGRSYLLGRIRGLEIRDTADWKSALRLPVGETPSKSGLRPFGAVFLIGPDGRRLGIDLRAEVTQADQRLGFA